MRSWDHLPRVERDRADLLGRESRRECNLLSYQIIAPFGGKNHLVVLNIAMPAPARAPQAVGDCLRLCPNLDGRGRAGPNASAKPKLATIESQMSLPAKTNR